MKKLFNLVKDSKGATAIEYGLIAALIAVAAMGALSAIGGNLDNTFQSVDDTLTEAQAS